MLPPGLHSTQASNHSGPGAEEPKGGTFSIRSVVVLFLSQRLCRIDSCNSQNWHDGSNERYRCEHHDDREDCGRVIETRGSASRCRGRRSTWAEGLGKSCEWSRHGTAHAVSERGLVKGRADALSWFVSEHGDGASWELRFHAAHGGARGGERSWIWATVSLSITRIGPPQIGQAQKARAFGSLAAGGESGTDSGLEFSNREQSGRNAARRRLARKPKLRMRTKPGGSRCKRKRRRNSSKGSVITGFWL